MLDWLLIKCFHMPHCISLVCQRRIASTPVIEDCFRMHTYKEQGGINFI